MIDWLADNPNVNIKRMSRQWNYLPTEEFSEISEREDFRHTHIILNRTPQDIALYMFPMFSLTSSHSHPFFCRLPHFSAQLPSLENVSHAASRFLKSRGWQGREKYLQGLVTNPGFGPGGSGLCLLPFKTLEALLEGSPLMVGGFRGLQERSDRGAR